MLQLHPDLPVEYDAWDIDEYYRRNVTDIDGVDRVEVTDHGPLVARVRVERSFRSSTVVQTYELRAGSPRLDVHLDIDWQERNHLLKLAWPVDVHANDVTRHIQYGHLKTPIHTNTTLGRGPVRAVRPPLDRRGGARVRRRAAQRRPLRPRRHPDPRARR